MNSCPSNLDSVECSGFYETIDASPQVNGSNVGSVCDNVCEQEAFVAQSYFAQTSGPACNSVPEDGVQGNNLWQIPAVTRWNNVIGCVLGLLGQPNTATLISDVDILLYGESSGNPLAVNKTDINYKEGHPSEGLIQVIQSTFNEYRSPLLPNNIWDPAANLFAGLNSGIHNYGSISEIPGINAVLNGKPYVGYISYQYGECQ
jgi:hypothetical protein